MSITFPTDNILHIIINFTYQCNYSCDFCITTSNPKNKKSLNFRNFILFLEQLKVLKEEKDIKVRFDISGGEFFLRDDWLLIYKNIRDFVGYENIFFSATHNGYKKFIKSEVSDDFNKVMKLFSIDTIDEEDDKNRLGLSINNLKFLEENKELLNFENIYIGTILYKNNTSLDRIKNLYEKLKNLGIKNWEICRLYPTGNLYNSDLYNEYLPNYENIIEVLEFLLKIEDIKIIFQHVWYFAELPEDIKKKILPKLTYKGCLVGTRINIIPNGDILLNGWAIDNFGNGINNFIIGHINENIDDIIKKIKIAKQSFPTHLYKKCYFGNKWWK